MAQALMIVDIQNDYFPGGAMELVGSSHAGGQAGKLLQAFRQRAIFFLPDTPGVRIHARVAPIDGEPVFQKHYPNSFRDTPLLEHLRSHQITQLVVAGMMTHMCIDTTVRAAFDLGFQCQVALDACATRALSFGGVTVSAGDVQATFLAALNGVFAKLSSADEICADLRAQNKATV